MRNWRTDHIAVSCETYGCGWVADGQRDMLAAGRRHKAQNPDHHVLAFRQQFKTIKAPELKGEQ